MPNNQIIPDEKILIVDDDLNLVRSLERQMSGFYIASFAESAARGLEMVSSEGPFAAVVSDYRMPGMDGITFMERVAELSPNTTRIFMTAYAELEPVINAINRGNVFRILHKPFPFIELHTALRDGITQYRVKAGEKDILERTISGIIRVLLDVLQIVKPSVYGLSMQMRRHALDLGRRMKLDSMWKLEISVMLSQLASVTMPEGTLDKIYKNLPLSSAEAKMLEGLPLIAADIVAKIPRLEEVAKIIKYHEKHFDGFGVPADDVWGKNIPVESRIIKIAVDYIKLNEAGKDPLTALRDMMSKEGKYDPEILPMLGEIISGGKKYELKQVRLYDLAAGMVIAEDIKSTDNSLVLPSGLELTMPILLRLRNLDKLGMVQPPFKMIVPVKS